MTSSLSLRDCYNNFDFAYHTTKWMHLNKLGTQDAAVEADLPEAFVFNNLARNPEAKQKALNELKASGFMPKKGPQKYRPKGPMTGTGIEQETYAGQMGPAHDPDKKCYQCKHWGAPGKHIPHTKFEVGFGRALADQACALARKFNKRSPEFPYDALSCKSFAERDVPLEVYQSTAMPVMKPETRGRKLGADEGPDPFN